MSRSMQSLIWNILFYILVAVIIVVSVFPFYYAVVSALRPPSDMFELSYWPKNLTFTNFEQVFSEPATFSVFGGKLFDLSRFAINLINSVIVATTVVVISLLLGVTAAYALGRIAFRGRGLLLMTVLAVSMFPQVAVLSGMFELVRALGLYNKLPSLVLANMLLTLPFTVWLLTTFMKDLPKELEEAAIVDGASPWIIIRRVFLPLMWPALVTTGLLAFIAAWNEFLFALTFTGTDNTATTVPVAIANFSGASKFETPWGAIMAASVIVTIPLIVLVLIFQRKIVAGLTAGAVKG
jgi:trehalose/maltose transport system permease protein